jgi:hypothetical protein
MRVRTTACAGANHAEFELEIGNIDTMFTDSLIDWLETEVQKGTRFEAYETVHHGSSMLQVRERSNGTLALYEPHPGSMPIVWIDSVEDSVMTMVRQREVAESVGLEDDLEFPAPMRTGYICMRARRGVRIGLIRNEPLEHDAGWCVMCTERDHDHADPDEIEALSLYELGLRVPELRLFQAMPVHTAVLIGGSKPLEVYFDKRKRSIVPGSMLDELRKK